MERQAHLHDWKTLSNKIDAERGSFDDSNLCSRLMLFSFWLELSLGCLESL